MMIIEIALGVVLAIALLTSNLEDEIREIMGGTRRTKKLRPERPKRAPVPWNAIGNALVFWGAIFAALLAVGWAVK